MSKLKNKVAVVTGASKGIGASIARHFAAEGAKVVVNYVKLFSNKGGQYHQYQFGCKQNASSRSLVVFCN
ncbi:SDR family NAD(P)-dependent oxidoreductase [Chitinophaga ginsengisoli]|uniref:Short subunit dehydrogenase n=1 Tax=Chitinophaga ginsengisoli TaxID=363837 RepID=A0A2P8GH38_9BACT|nr:SDR family NAD(P)-dependent oxidoreductase [Chitinophaga ginsengisoli]PSL33283.1 short subunit dehydrogenase [Chitinophaga ginsengisoli]